MYYAFYFKINCQLILDIYLPILPKSFFDGPPTVEEFLAKLDMNLEDYKINHCSDSRYEFFIKEIYISSIG